ncbi:glycosyltransferase [Winogradskyella haliclonae]|uniref:Glycosyl transferase n=1 Tax=Winogradskyella haliclonae TaxID=2048558 RepID=A0ABQ2BVK4_9FLAO|nr:glycosyltransferase [Winogradskyella haliclonae]GGI55891.1 glycosyl transferase [Winogradskyella haliclonae]
MTVTTQLSSTYNKKILKQAHNRKRILVAPLCWGLGHATRCIPIINALISQGLEPVIASDGGALELLKKEFPKLSAFELPSYNISYSKKSNGFKLKFLKASPHILKTIKRERKRIEQLVETENIDGIISDNRFGVRHKAIPSVYITHQLNVLSGKTTWLSSKWHQDIIKKFDECWVPDFEHSPNLSGELGHTKRQLNNVKYIGPLSRFKKQTSEENIDILVILSGPEPQRTQLEKKLLFELKNKKESVVFVRGLVEGKQKMTIIDNIKMYNYMTSNELETAINSSKLIVSRSGYTTIMDLAKLGKKAIFIPTPGQFEQLYLAKKLSENSSIPFIEQDNFSFKDLNFNTTYTGFKAMEAECNYKKLFGLF